MITKKKLFSISLITSFCSIQYELLLANFLGFILKDFFFWNSLVIGIYILGLGLGAFRFDSKIQNDSRLNKDSILDLFRQVEKKLYLISVFSIPLIYLFYYITKYFFLDAYIHSYEIDDSPLFFFYKSLFASVSMTIPLAIGYYSGFELPFILKINQIFHHETEEGKFLAIYHIGHFIGSIFLSLILSPLLDIEYTMLITGIINLILYFSIYPRKNKFREVFILLIPLVCVLYFSPQLKQYFLKAKYITIYKDSDKFNFKTFNKIILKSKDITRVRSLYQKLDFIPHDGTYTLAIDYNEQFTGSLESKYHELFAHIPLIFEDRVPEEVLVLGAGDGLLAEELLKYRKIKKITQIELDPKMIELANTHPLLTQYNHHSLQNERVNLIIGDAFQFIRNSTKKYDAIYVDFPFPFNFNLSKLFSVEFYKLLYNSINEDGFITLDLPLGRYIKNEIYITEPIKNINAIAFSTLKAAGFKTIKPYFSDEDSFVYLKKKKIENFRSYTQTFFNRETPGKKFNYLTLKNFKKTLNATFPYSRGNQYINSIFKPTSMHYLFYINSL